MNSPSAHPSTATCKRPSCPLRRAAGPAPCPAHVTQTAHQPPRRSPRPPPRPHPAPPYGAYPCGASLRGGGCGGGGGSGAHGPCVPGHPPSTAPCHPNHRRRPSRQPSPQAWQNARRGSRRSHPCQAPLHRPVPHWRAAAGRPPGPEPPLAAAVPLQAWLRNRRQSRLPLRQRPRRRRRRCGCWTRLRGPVRPSGPLPGTCVQQRCGESVEEKYGAKSGLTLCRKSFQCSLTRSIGQDFTSPSCPFPSVPCSAPFPGPVCLIGTAYLGASPSITATSVFLSRLLTLTVPALASRPSSAMI